MRSGITRFGTCLGMVSMLLLATADRADAKSVKPKKPNKGATLPVSPATTFKWRGKGDSFQVNISPKDRFLEAVTLVYPEEGGTENKKWRPNAKWWADILRMGCLAGGKLYWKVDVYEGDKDAKAKPKISHFQFEEYLAVMTTRSAGFDAGSVATVEGASPWTAQADLLDSLVSDQAVASYGNWVFVIQKGEASNVIKLHKDRVGAADVLWQASVREPSGAASNPHELGFVSKKKAYLTRYESTKLWIVDPSAKKADKFKKGQINLAALADADGIPEMSNIVVVPDKDLAFVTLQRVDRTTWTPTDAYLAVIDTKKDELVDPAGKVPGIALEGVNPTAIGYLPETDRVYVVCTGQYFPQTFSGGIEVVNPTTLESEGLLIDDGDGEAAHGGQFFGGLALFSTKLAAVGVYAGWGDNGVITFNPTTGTVYGPLGALTGRTIDTLAAGPFKHLWVGDGTDSGINIYNPETGDRVAGPLDTGLIPSSITFVKMGK